MSKLQKVENTPEARELEKKQRVLARLRNRLAEEEEHLLEFQTELKEFETRYTNEVGCLYADLDEIEAEIAEEEFKLVPDDEEIRKRAEELRARAAASGQAAEQAQFCTHKYHPTTKVKTQYRDIARKVHPDLATDDDDRGLRHRLMAEANKAYEEGDEETLSRLLGDWHESPDTVKGADIGADLVRVIRQLAQVKKRFGILRSERIRLEESENNTLRLKVETEMREGRNLFRQMAARARSHISRAERRLKELRENTSQIPEFQSFQVKTDWEKLYQDIDNEKGETEGEVYDLDISSLR